MGLERAFRRGRSRVWMRIGGLLFKARRRRITVNVSKISRHGVEGKVMVVPGKVLGAGVLNKKLKVAALAFTETAKKKIEEAGGEAVTLEFLLESQVKGDDIRIIG